MNIRNARFIGTFVNEIYAILLGVGMGSIVFRKDFSITDGLNILSALFIIMVVAVYWWDWVENVEEQILSSFREFFIDLAITFTFLVLFAFYDQPMVLSGIFCILSFLDFLWVLNNNFEHYQISTITSKNFKQNITKKIFSIVIFSFSFFIVNFILNESHKCFQLVTVIFSFIAVRIFCFSHIKKINNLILRKAEICDVKRIIELHNNQVINHDSPTCEDGFLLKEVTENDVRDKLESSKSILYVAVNIQAKILGFVEITRQPPAEIIQSVKWRDAKYQNLFKEKQHCHILTISLSRRYMGKGLGKTIYERLKLRYPDALLSAFVALKPIRNDRSLKFHLGQNFKEIGDFEQPEFLGLKNYKSVLLAYIDDETENT